MQINEPKIFVAIPFAPEFEGVRSLINKAAGLTGTDAIAMDQVHAPGSIVSQIRQQINEADVIIADLSRENGNVYYEVGLAHSLGKPVIILTSDLAKLRFDLKDHRAILYDPNKPSDALENLVKAITAILGVSKNKEEYVTPEAYISGSFSGNASDDNAAYKKGLEKAMNTIVALAKLDGSPEISSLNYVPEERSYEIEVRDFLGNRARAIVDINGFVTKYKKID